LHIVKATESRFGKVRKSYDGVLKGYDGVLKGYEGF
jgi:hypothetical protein